MNENKICPLVSIAAATTGSSVPVHCLGERCAWWNTLFNHQTGEAVNGECTILTIGDVLDAIEKRI